ncbi:hypothetical protein LOD99_7328 [Oopsacas minuta]|uniref:Uncharacterized protein n=1 Tax=Oopsacas minuta TaxID=111878 RepID=A0AAV7JUC6_9METZ|nr:hypothetical protein LOD99_7328 [Oopsacas minuta]
MTTQDSHNSISKLIIAPETVNANKALQPGTPFLLQGCMCQEGDGVIVVKVNWRDKIYTGSLMDMEQYQWATPKHVEIAELGSPLDKELRFSPRLQLNQPKQNVVSNQEVEDQQPKENDVVMSPQSSDMVESEEGRSPDVIKHILPKLNNCTELNKTSGGLFTRSRQSTLGLLTSPSTSLTDLKAESEKKKTHDLHTGITHPKEVVIPSILGDGNVLPFDTSSREKSKLEIDIKGEIREDITPRPVIVNTRRSTDVLPKPVEQPIKKEGFAPARQMMPQMPFFAVSPLPQSLPNMSNLDPKQRLVKPIPTLTDYQNMRGGEFIHKHDSISPKSSTPDSPNELKPMKKRKNENNHDHSIPKRPDTLVLETHPEHHINYITPDLTTKIPIRLDESSNIRSHASINKALSLPHQTHPTSPSGTHTPKPVKDRMPYNSSDFILTKDNYSTTKILRDNNGKERHEKHIAYAQPQLLPHFPTNRTEKSRIDKKTKRQREGGSPSDHKLDATKTSHSFIPSDSKMPSLITPNVKLEAQQQLSYPTPELLPYFYPPIYVQNAPGLPTLPPGFVEQQKLFQQANLQDVKVESEKVKQKSNNTTNKSKSQAKLQQPADLNYFPQHGHLPINPPVLTQNHLALMMNQSIPISMLAKESAVAGGLAIPSFPVMVEQEKDKTRPYSQPTVTNLQQKISTPSSHSNSNSSRKITEKSLNHDTPHEEISHSHYSQDVIKQWNAHQYLLKHPEITPNNIEPYNNNNTIKIGHTFKQTPSTTPNSNNKIVNNTNPTLAVLNSNQQLKNGLFPSPLFPFVAMTPEYLQQISLLGSVPFPPPIDPSLPLTFPYYDPIAMRLPQAQVQPDTLDSAKW